jgi:DNA-binding CsgD family transcriptional regulator
MPADKPVRRNRTARELAEQFGVSERTIRNIAAEPRPEYLARAQDRRRRIAELRAQGKTMRAIADQLGVSVGLVATYAKQAQLAEQTNQDKHSEAPQKAS